MMTIARLAIVGTFVFLAPTVARADGPPCNAWEVEYVVTGHLRISDTAMGAGNGTHAIGPGKLVVRYENVVDQPGGTARVTSYEITNKFVVDAHFLGFGTTVVNDTTTRTTPNVCGASAEGSLAGDRTIRWTTPWNGIHTDGYQECSGSMCGRFGAPPRGRSELHTSPHQLVFKPFVFSPDMKSFHMDEVVTSRSSSDTASLTLDGRETRRTAVYSKPCP